eukprot:1160184-Pelagomonas_calceolata.AAC.10
MHTKHRLGYAAMRLRPILNILLFLLSELVTSVDKEISNDSGRMSCIFSSMKRTILQHCTSTLYNKKHVARFVRSIIPFCPLPGCHQLDIAFHSLLGCQNHIISSMKTERQN